MDSPRVQQLRTRLENLIQRGARPRRVQRAMEALHKALLLQGGVYVLGGPMAHNGAPTTVVVRATSVS